MNLVGKKEDEINARKITKEKLKVTKVPRLVLGYQDEIKVYFREHYQYLRFLGTGSFGFVVAGHQLPDTKTIYALKVSKQSINYPILLIHILINLHKEFTLLFN